MNAGTICYAQLGPVFVLKFSGEIRYTMGCSLDDFLKKLFKRSDFETILIDLTETQSIDSTSLGLLAKVANFMLRQFHKKTPLVCTNEDVNQVLDSMGFDEIFDICDCHQACPEGLKAVKLASPLRRKMAETVIDAHKTLCEMNEKNHAVFKNVVEALESENKSKGKSKNKSKNKRKIAASQSQPA